MSALMKMGLLTKEQAAQITDAQAEHLAQIATSHLQALATSNKDVQAALKANMSHTVGAVTGG